MEDKTLDIMYDGFIEYMKKIRGYADYPTIYEVAEWEKYKDTVYEALKKRREASSEKSIRSKLSQK